MSSDSGLIIEIQDLVEQRIPHDEYNLAEVFSERVSVLQLALAGVAAEFAVYYGRPAADKLVEMISETMSDALDTRLKIENLN